MAASAPGYHVIDLDGKDMPPGITAASAPSPDTPPTYANTFKDRIEALCAKHGIDGPFKSALFKFSECHIITLLDDSGSMNANVDGTKNTRWDELKTFVDYLLEFSRVFDPLGMDMHFLNRTGKQHITIADDITTLFNNPPRGGTPLVTKLEKIYADYKDVKRQKVLFIATDGEPDDDVKPYDKMRRILLKLSESGFHITFIICADNELEIEYVKKFDSIQNIDVVDDYHTEMNNIKRIQGSHFEFTYGDYITKALCGSFNEVLDKLNEIKLTESQIGRKPSRNAPPAVARPQTGIFTRFMRWMCG